MIKTIKTENVLGLLGIDSNDARVAQHLLRHHIGSLAKWISQALLSQDVEADQCAYLSNCIQDLGKRVFAKEILDIINQFDPQGLRVKNSPIVAHFPVEARVHIGILDHLIENWEEIDHYAIAVAILNAIY